MAKEKTKDRRGTGKVHFDFDEPKDPLDVGIWSLVPFEARITSVEIKYIRLSHYTDWADYDANSKEIAVRRKRHDAAVKANATRKAKKEAVQP